MYTIKILSSDEFDKLPFSRVRKSLGVADPKKMIAYVRDTSIDDLNKYLINHELDHLVEEIPTDEFEGVRYKGFGDMFNSIGGGIKSAGSSLWSGAKNLGSGVGNLFGMGGQAQPQPTAGSNPFTYGQSNPFAYGPMAGGTVGRSSFTPPAISSHKPSYGGGMSSGSGGGGGGFGGLFSGFGNMIKSNAPLAAGIGTMLGSQLIRGPKVPQLPQSATSFQSRLTGGTSIGNLANQRTTELLNQPLQAMTDAEVEAILRPVREKHQQEHIRLSNTYMNAQPGNDYLTNSAYGNDKRLLDEQQAREIADVVANKQRDIQAQNMGFRLQEIAQARGMSQEQLQNEAAAVGYDIDAMMAKFNVGREDALSLRNYLMNFGGQLALMGVNPNYGLMANFGGG